MKYEDLLIFFGNIRCIQIEVKQIERLISFYQMIELILILISNSKKIKVSEKKIIMACNREDNKKNIKKIILLKELVCHAVKFFSSSVYLKN